MRTVGWSARWRVAGGVALTAFALLVCTAKPASSGLFSNVGKAVDRVADKDSKDSREVSKPGTVDVRSVPTGRVVTGPISSPHGLYVPGSAAGGSQGRGGGILSGMFDRLSRDWGHGASSGTSGNSGRSGNWGNSGNVGGRPTVTVPRGGGSNSVPTVGDRGWLFGQLGTGPRGHVSGGSGQPVIGNYYGSTSGQGYRPVISSGRGSQPVIGSGGGQFFATVVDKAPRGRHSGSGYFDTIRQLMHGAGSRGWHDRSWWWYYPYDFRFYHWYYGYYDPFDAYYPFAAYVVSPPPYYLYYVYRPPVVLVTPPPLWITIWADGTSYRYSDDRDYYPYVERVDGALAGALRDIERGWRNEDLGLVMRHVDPDGDIRVLYRKEYSHTLTAREFEDLTREAFANTETESFRFTDVKRERDGDEAVAKGKHVLRDPNGESRVVYVIYLLEQARDRYGDWDWFVREVGQSPEAY